MKNKKVNWKTYCQLKYGIAEKKVIEINLHDKNFDLPLSNLYKEY